MGKDIETLQDKRKKTRIWGFIVMCVFLALTNIARLETIPLLYRSRGVVVAFDQYISTKFTMIIEVNDPMGNPMRIRSWGFVNSERRCVSIGDSVYILHSEQPKAGYKDPKLALGQIHFEDPCSKEVPVPQEPHPDGYDPLKTSIRRASYFFIPALLCIGFIYSLKRIWLYAIVVYIALRIFISHLTG